MNTNNMSTELIAALTKAETDFGLSDVLHKYGVTKNELITVEFKHGNEVLFVSQRLVGSASVQVSWMPIESATSQQLVEDIGREIAEIFCKADVLSTIKSLLKGRELSAKNPAIIEFKLINGMQLTSLRCPCPDPTRRCCPG